MHQRRAWEQTNRMWTCAFGARLHLDLSLFMHILEVLHAYITINNALEHSMAGMDLTDGPAVCSCVHRKQIHS